MNQFQKSCYIVLLFFGVASGGFAQKPAGPLAGRALVDSLLKELAKAKEDTNKVKLLNDLSYDCSAVSNSVNPDEGINYGQQGAALAERLQWERGIAGANSSIAVNYLTKINYPKALEYYFKSLKEYEEIGDKKNMARVTGSLGVVYQNQNDYPRALEYLLKALKMSEESGNKISTMFFTGNTGNIYYYQGDYAKALEYFFKHLKLAEETGDKSEIARATESIGDVYDEAYNDYPRALEYHFKALKIDEEIGYKIEIARITGNIASIYTEQKNYLMAITYCQKNIKMNDETGNRHDAAWSLFRMGNVYLTLAEDTAINQDNSITRDETAKGKYLPSEQAGLPGGLIPAGKTLRLHYAIMYLQRALDSARQINTLELVWNCYLNLSEAQKLNGDYRQALESYQNYTSINDSLFSKENEKKIMHTAMQYDYDKTHLADSLKSAEKEKITAIELQRQRSYTYMGIAGALLLLGFSFFMLRNNKLLGEEKKRSENLLLNILPSEVAEELKDTGSAAAKYYDNVTVLFTDFVNFTKASEKLSPQALIDELHTCFKTFDEITAKYNIEKIKTIGDAYLAVCGLPIADPKHAENIVHAAIEINNFMGDRYAKLGDQTFEVRIGIHSGSVVAGIVGVKKFAYDIWGDTVNTAARMEQSSEAGKINISQVTYELVKDKFACAYRGEINAKNKGMLKMYFVNP